jgi:hypothetical protein
MGAGQPSGAHAGAGLAALRLLDIDGARGALESALRRLDARYDWWFQKRELLEGLAIRLLAHDGRHDEAESRLHHAVERLEESDGYAAAWLVADCAATLAERDPTVWAHVERLASHPTVQQFVPLSARFTALRDMKERLPSVRFAGPGTDEGQKH